MYKVEPAQTAQANGDPDTPDPSAQGKQSLEVSFSLSKLLGHSAVA